MTRREPLLSCLAAQGSELKRFEQFLTLEFATENLTFWKRCSTLLKTPTHDTAADIIQHHLLRDAELEINLPAALKKPLIRGLIQLPPQTDAVEMAQEHVLEILLEPFSRFIQTNPEIKETSGPFKKMMRQFSMKISSKKLEPEAIYAIRKRSKIHSFNIDDNALYRCRQARSRSLRKTVSAPKIEVLDMISEIS